MSPASDPVLQEFLNRIAPLRSRIEKMILFGSCARGDEKPYSDYDVLIIVPERTPKLAGAIFAAVTDVLLSTGRLISPKIFRKKDFDAYHALSTPFMRNIEREGIVLG